MVERASQGMVKGTIYSRLLLHRLQQKKEGGAYGIEGGAEVFSIQERNLKLTLSLALKNDRKGEQGQKK